MINNFDSGVPKSIIPVQISIDLIAETLYNNTEDFPTSFETKLVMQASILISTLAQGDQAGFEATCDRVEALLALRKAYKGHDDLLNFALTHGQE